MRRQQQRRQGRISEGRQLRQRGPGVNPGDGISRREILRSGHRGMGTTSALEPRRHMRRRRRRRNKDPPVLRQTGIFGMKAERFETKSNEVRAMELKAQVFEAERARARQSWRENAIKAELAEAKERKRRSEIKGEQHVRFLGQKIWKVKESLTNHEVGVLRNGDLDEQGPGGAEG